MLREYEMIDILLLEDELADAYLVNMALKESNILINLHHVVDGREGLNFLHKVGKYASVPFPDLILLDLNMPCITGHEFLERVKSDSILKDVPIIVLTTSDTESDIVRSYKLGASSFITKPVDMTQFVAAIHQLNNYWFKLVRLPKGYKI